MKPITARFRSPSAAGRRSWTTPFAATVATLLAGLVGAFALEAETITLTHEPVFVASPSTARLEASVLWGNLEVVATDGGFLELQATVEGELRAAPSAEQGPLTGRIRLAVEEEDGVLRVSVPSELPGFYGVDLRLEVPRELALDLRMERGGEILVNGAAGPVEVDNRNGSARLQGLEGSAVVVARNGSIDVDFLQVEPAAAMAFASLNGSVDVTFPPEVAAEVRARTSNGEVESDFPGIRRIEAAPSADEKMQAGSLASGAFGEAAALAPKLYTGTLNGGGAPYFFFSANGTVYLRRGGA